MFIITDKTSDERRKVEGVGVVKDKELEFEETEASLTLGGSGEGRVQERRKGETTKLVLGSSLGSNTASIRGCGPL